MPLPEPVMPSTQPCGDFSSSGSTNRDARVTWLTPKSSDRRGSPEMTSEENGIIAAPSAVVSERYALSMRGTPRGSALMSASSWRNGSSTKSIVQRPAWSMSSAS